MPGCAQVGLPGGLRWEGEGRTGLSLWPRPWDSRPSPWTGSPGDGRTRKGSSQRCVCHTLPDPLCSEVPGGWGAVAAAPGRVDLGRAHRREALGGDRERGAPSLLRRHRHRHRPSGGPAPARPPEALGPLSLPLPRALEALMAAVGPRTPHYPRQSFSDLPSPRGLFPGLLLAVPLE